MLEQISLCDFEGNTHTYIIHTYNCCVFLFLCGKQKQVKRRAVYFCMYSDFNNYWRRKAVQVYVIVSESRDTRRALFLICAKCVTRVDSDFLATRRVPSSKVRDAQKQPPNKGRAPLLLEYQYIPLLRFEPTSIENTLT